jgi:2-keto-3-deoxy-L-rhamnonate aldolase RhmA
VSEHDLFDFAAAISSPRRTGVTKTLFVNEIGGAINDSRYIAASRELGPPTSNPQLTLEGGAPATPSVQGRLDFYAGACPDVLGVPDLSAACVCLAGAARVRTDGGRTTEDHSVILYDGPMTSLNNIERFRERIAAGKLCVGTGITFSDPAVSELAGEVGYDFTWIDMEHGPIDLPIALGHVMAVRGTQTAPFVRVRVNDPDVIKPVLDLAPAGVIVPNVKSAAAARSAVQACRYPPQGTRGYGPRRGQRFGRISQAEYLEQVKDEPIVILQIEHIDAVNCLDDILEVPGIDSICLGPNDLSGSLGKLGQFDDAEVIATVNKVAERVRAAGPMLGVATFYSEENFARWKQVGVQWMSLNVDWGNLASAARNVLDSARQEK